MAFDFLDLLRNAGIDIDNKEILRLILFLWNIFLRERVKGQLKKMLEKMK
jgi:hypothetical protein